MKIDLFNTSEFIELNHLKQITSPYVIQRGDVPDPDGLVSNEIFGTTSKSRRRTFAFIDLHGHFFHPHIYKVIKRIFRNVEKIINGESYYSINKQGKLVPDNENGETGLEFLYNNWEKIKWDKSESFGMRNERIDLITSFPKDQIFTKYQIVIPAFYRDVTHSSRGGGTNDLNQMYSKLIRLTTTLRDQGLFDFQFNNTNYNIQNLLVDIYDFFKIKLEKKNGMIRKYLMGKNVDLCTRTVITCPQFHMDAPGDSIVDFEHAAVPLSQALALAQPFILQWLKSFFEREIFDNKYGKIVFNPQTGEVEDKIELKNPEAYFNEKYFIRMIDTFVKDPSSRFNLIEVPTNEKVKRYLYFQGVKLNPDGTEELASIGKRPMTWTDLLYMAASDVTEGKHLMTTRYPLLDEFGIFFAKVRIASTQQTDIVSYNGKIYKYYPHIDFVTRKDRIALRFIDSTMFSLSYLKGLSGDYDGDQTTSKIIFTQEANEEIDKYMKSKAFFLNVSGKNMREIGNESIQTYYALTKNPDKNSKEIVGEDKKMLIDIKPEDITFTLFTQWFSDNYDRNGKKKRKSKFNVNDIIKITPSEYPLVKKPITTTVGRLIFTKLIIELCHLENIFGFVNETMDDDSFKDFQTKIQIAYTEGDMNTDQMYKYIDVRDWVGLQFHAVITTSFTPGVLKIPPEVAKLKKELIKKYKDELSTGNPRVAAMIEDELINKTKEVLKDDPGMDLYLSKARGSIENNFKNMYLMRGSVLNSVTGKYEIVENSFSDGLDKKDMAVHANSILAGAYPKACGTADSGYLAKELIAILQTETLGEPDSDCGTNGYITTVIPSNTSDYHYRYIIENGKLVLLRPNVIKDYVGKVVKMRSPMMCTGVGEGNNYICSKCAGEYFNMIGKRNIGLLGSRVATSCTNLNMKKFHSNLVKQHRLDINKII